MSSNDPGGWQDVARAVIAARMDRGWSQDKAAHEAGIGVTTWRDIEAAKRHSYRMLTIAAVARALGHPADWLVHVLFGAEQDERDPEIVADVHEALGSLGRPDDAVVATLDRDALTGMEMFEDLAGAVTALTVEVSGFRDELHALQDRVAHIEADSSE